MLVVGVGRANVPSAWKNISGEVGALELGKTSPHTHQRLEYNMI